MARADQEQQCYQVGQATVAEWSTMISDLKDGYIPSEIADELLAAITLPAPGHTVGNVLPVSGLC